MNFQWWIVPLVVVFCSTSYGAPDELVLDKYVCGRVEGPFIDKPTEKCSDSSTTQTFSNFERHWSLFNVNLFRGHVANKCNEINSNPPSASNYRRLEWSCEFEDELKFECPKKVDDFKSDSMIYRYSYFTESENGNLDVEHESNLWRASNFDEGFTKTLEKQFHITRLFFNQDATEFACYRKICHFEDGFHELLACKNGFNLEKEGLPYTPGEKCKQDSDCTIGPHLKCDKPFGLCQTTESCRVPSSEYKHCSNYNVQLSYVMIASKTQKDLFDFKGIATIVGKRHLLTSISHFATELHDNEMLLLVQNSFEAFKNKKLKPSFYVSVYNTNNWSDFVLITLDENSNYVFPNDLINQVTTQLDGKKTTVTNDLSTKEIKFQSVEHCEEAFSVDHIRYDKNTMYCAEDDTESPGDFLNGSPIYVKTATGTKLMGIRSVNSLHSKFKRTYMIQRLDKHCDWLAKASYGHVKCTND